MKTTKLTWNGDVHAALAAVGQETNSRWIFNDRHKTCRRLKFAARELTDEQLRLVQNVIQERRPDLSVTVSKWDSTYGWQGFGNVVVYYRPKVGRYMNH